MAEALYRKYRPQIFEDVVGQEHIERTIKNAIAQDKVSHAYLFTGPRGTGKTTTARLLAKALLCENGPTAEPDGTCEDCELIAAGEHPDVYELDAASRTGVENVREEIIGRVNYAPTRGRYKVYIIDEVHMLSVAAFNALLKTLEEPPSHVVFILATTDPQKVPETIHSRCQRFDFRRISTEAMVSRLGAICEMENVEFEGEALELVAQRAEGGMRNALTSLEQLIAFGDGAVTMEVAERLLGSVDSTDLADIVRAVGARDAAASFRWVADYVETGADLAQFAGDLAQHIRNMYVMAVAGSDVALDVTETTRRELANELPLFGADRLARLLDVLGDVSAELKTSTNPRLTFEIALTRMVRPETDMTLEALAERVESLERQLAAGLPTALPLSSAPAAPPAPAPAPAAAVPASAPAPVPAAEAPAVPAPAPKEARPASVIADVQGEPEAPVAPSAPAPTAAPAAPASAPAPGALAPALADQLSNPAALQRIWHAVQGTLKKTKAAYGALFLTTKASFDKGAGTLVIEFPAESEFAYRVVTKPDVQQELARALQQAAGAPVPFVLRQLKEGGGANQAPVAVPAAASPAPIAAPSASASAPIAAPSASASAPAPISAPAPAPAPVPTPAPAAPAPVSDDVPPYDDYVPYGDDDIPFEDPYRPSTPPPAPATAAAPAAAAPSPASVSKAEEVPPWESAPAPTPAAPADDGPAVSDADLNASLAFGFGDGITFEEVL